MFSPFDEIHPYEGILKDSFYYVETEAYFPAKGNEIYSRAELEYFKDIGLEHRIVHQDTPST